MLDVAEILKEAWRHYVARWQSWVILGLVYFAVTVVAAFTCIGGLFVAGPLMAGLYVAAFKQLRGQPFDVSDLWAGFQFFASSTGIVLLGGFLILLGCIFFLIPGLLLAVWWYFALSLCVARGTGMIESMSLSRQAVSGRFWDVVILILVLVAVHVVTGFVPFGGILIGLPIQTLAVAIAHRNIFGLEGALPPLQDAPPAAPPVTRYCVRCGAPNFAAARFCTGCGNTMA